VRDGPIDLLDGANSSARWISVQSAARSPVISTASPLAAVLIYAVAIPAVTTVPVLAPPSGIDLHADQVNARQDIRVAVNG
jgi:hypothetical protein